MNAGELAWQHLLEGVCTYFLRLARIRCLTDCQSNFLSVLVELVKLAFNSLHFSKITISTNH